MTYVIYADVMFVWILIINYLTYFITCKITLQRIGNIKLILWSLISTIILEILYISIIKQGTLILTITYVCTYVVLLIIFIRLILGIKQTIEFIRFFVYSFVGAAILAGIIQIFVQRSISIYTLSPVVVIICFLIPLIMRLLPTKRFSSDIIHLVSVYTANYQINTKGYIDTGNTLKDIHNGNPVIIMDYSLLQPILSEDEYSLILKYADTGCYEFISILSIDQEKLYPLPYQTVSNRFSIMPAFKIKKLVIDNDSTYENLSVGISQYSFSRGEEYKILLNNNL